MTPIAAIHERLPEIATAEIEGLSFAVVHETGDAKGRELRCAARFPDADVLGTGRLASSPFGSGLASGAGSDPESVKAGARAHNRWLAELCQASPDRRAGVAIRRGAETEPRPAGT